ncbi:MAG TPA: (2Fe-2S) ferredoxin domain-containing protein [archaeon]|nr:(2Fe-2S) ferredoxin domain-containing protein [archaeon]
MFSFKKHVLVCTNEKPLHCAEKGGLEVLRAFREEVEKRGLKNDFYVTKTGCTSQHHCGPTVIIYPDGVWYKEVKASDIPEIIESHLLNGKIVGRIHNTAIGLQK